MEPSCKAEKQAIEWHRHQLEQERGYEVDYDEAIEDWLENHAPLWRQLRQAHMLAMQREAINRYKWIESEKAQHDLGREAVMVWIKKNAAAWRRWYEEEYEPRVCQGYFYNLDNQELLISR